MPTRTRFQRELLALAGIDADRIVDSDEVPHVRADLLLVPTVPDLDLEIPSWVVAFLRERLLPSGLHRVPGRNVYVTRGDAPHTRRVTNEDEVLRVLSPARLRRGGSVDPERRRTDLDVRDRDMIVAPHGAALSNLAFASPGAAVLEFFPPDFVQGCYWKLATCVDGPDLPIPGRGRTYPAQRRHGRRNQRRGRRTRRCRACTRCAARGPRRGERRPERGDAVNAPRTDQLRRAPWPLTASIGRALGRTRL